MSVRIEKYKTMNASYLVGSIQNRIRVSSDRSPKTRRSLINLAHSNLDLALTFYGLGNAYADVLAQFDIASEAFVSLFEFFDPKYPTTKQVQSPIDDEGSLERTSHYDFSMTNSCESVLGIMVCLCAGRLNEAERVAQLAGAPARWSSHGQRQLERSLQAFFRDDENDATMQLDDISADAEWQVFATGRVLSAMLKRDGRSIKEALADLIVQHANEAKQASEAQGPFHNLCIHGIGAIVLGLSRNIITIENVLDLPPYFPKDLVTFCLDRRRKDFV